jgi:NAD(P)-dependent dehydrogenase (short-subunit alcohol dehydrogenase family)
VRHVLIVGATDGIGLALAREYAGRSWRVGLVGRDRKKVQEIVDMLSGEHPGGTIVGEHPGGTIVGGVLDVTVRDAVKPALDSTLDTLGQMDLLIYSAGVMDVGPAAEEEMLRVNTLAAVDVCEWAAAYFTRAGQGRIAAIGSTAGDRGRKGNPVYGASKAALHQYLEGLRARLHPDGVGVTTVKPGWVRTRMLGDVPGFPPSISAAKAADLIRRGIERGRDSFYVPAWWEAISILLRLTPRFLFKRMAPP